MRRLASTVPERRPSVGNEITERGRERVRLQRATVVRCEADGDILSAREISEGIAQRRILEYEASIEPSESCGDVDAVPRGHPSGHTHATEIRRGEKDAVDVRNRRSLDPRHWHDAGLRDAMQGDRPLHHHDFHTVRLGVGANVELGAHVPSHPAARVAGKRACLVMHDVEKGLAIEIDITPSAKHGNEADSPRPTLRACHR